MTTTTTKSKRQRSQHFRPAYENHLIKCQIIDIFGRAVCSRASFPSLNFHKLIEVHVSSTPTLKLEPTLPVLYRLISKKTYSWPELKESDIEEEFIRGSGPGGQAVAKTSNCVQLKHKPSGIVVKSHETRSQAQNRKIAREKLIYQLDILYNKENSFDAISKRESALRKQSVENKAKKRLVLKKEFKAREGLD